MKLTGQVDVPPLGVAEVTLWVEPESEVELLGFMIHDAELVVRKLRELPFSADAYRGELRVMLGAARRTERRLLRMLGEDELPAAKGKPAKR